MDFLVGNMVCVYSSSHFFQTGDPLSSFFSETEEAENYSLAVAKALAMTGIDLLLKPDLVQQAKQTFHEALEAEKRSV